MLFTSTVRSPIREDGNRFGGDMTFYQADTKDARMNSFGAAFQTFQRTKLYDLLTGMPLVVWYAVLLFNQIPPLVDQILSFDLATADARFFASLASKLATQIFFMVLALLMVVRRKPLDKASGFYPKFAAVLGTFMSVLLVQLPPRDLSVSFHVISTLLIFCGVGFSIYAVLKLGRSLSMLPEARRLVTSGPYSVIRHPLYVSEAVALFGLTLQYLSPWALALFVLQCIFQLARMHNEEIVLSRAFPEYRDYAARTARLVPGLY
jgi:protein-S-isoprenylcysteine O-methyltransferase Ste14